MCMRPPRAGRSCEATADAPAKYVNYTAASGTTPPGPPLRVTRPPYEDGHEQGADRRQHDEQAPPSPPALVLHHHERDRQPGLLLLREAPLVEPLERILHLERRLVAPRDQLEDLVQIRRREPHVVQRREIRVPRLEVRHRLQHSLIRHWSRLLRGGERGQIGRAHV